MKMKSAEFISLSACTMTLTALGIDIMLPAFGELRQHFGLGPESTATAQIITFFFMGQVAQIIFGVLSDRFVGDQMARIMSLIFTIFLFTPVLAPFLGLAILSVSSWQMVFLTPPIFAVIIFLWSLRLEESLPREQRLALNWISIRQSIWKVLSNRIFFRYTSVATLLFTALSSYVSSSEHIVGEIYGKPKLFAWIFAAIGLVMAFCTLMNSRLSSRYGARRSIKWLLTIYMVVASILLLFTFIFGDPPGMFVFFIAVALLMGINLAVEPNSSALALEPMGKIAGIASAVYGTFFFSIGASLGSIISKIMVKGVFPLVVSFFIIGLITVLLVFSDRHTISKQTS